jgi:hypothetical protein
MSKTKWHKGEPPSIGWWPASYSKQKDILRWWNGKRWSHRALTSYTSKEAAAAAAKPSGMGLVEIEWSERWWL